jgi:N-6 DNA Methylase
MSDVAARIKEFIQYAGMLAGDEKGEAQVFCDRLFRGFGHGGYKEAGATLEYRVKNDTGGTSFADLIWKPRVLIEMKKRGSELQLHYQQAFEYWLHAVPNRPRYVVLCNFDEFWIYDFDRQLHEPMDQVAIGDLLHRYTALNFLFPQNPKPQFGNDREAVSIKAAEKVAHLFTLLMRGFRPNLKNKQKITREQAQRFVLQIVVAMFAEDIDLLPQGIVKSLVDECLENKASSYDLFGALFHQMNNQAPAQAGRFAGVPYFNGGLFGTIEPIEMNATELETLGAADGAALQDWSKVNPAIFGTLFQRSMDEKQRHKRGAHYTSEADIQRIVGPTITRPILERINAAESAKDLIELRRKIRSFRVLDPACGSGNFLYVSYRELARLETQVLAKLREAKQTEEVKKELSTLHGVSPKQFYGIEIDSFGVELAKVTLMLGKKLAIDEANETLGLENAVSGTEDALPLDNLDGNIINTDALFSDWNDVDAIIGNPPYQSKNKLQQELGPPYLRKLRERYPDIDGRSDYCVYWFRRAHDHLKPGQRAGLVGTNTIRQNYRRESGLDRILDGGGTITEAVSSMVWPGEANLHVSIVNWIKGDHPGMKRLSMQVGNDPNQGWMYAEVSRIPASLSFSVDVTKAKKLHVNADGGGCYQGQTHGHDGFLLEPRTAKALIQNDPKYAEVVFPFLIADDLLGEINSKPTRYVIDFHSRSMPESKVYKLVFAQVRAKVLPDRERAAEEEQMRNKPVLAADPNAHVNQHHANFLKRWWLMSYPRQDMIKAISKYKRYLVCGQVTKRPIFEFVSVKIRPNAALNVFAHDDDYSFGILHSGIHWKWFVERCSTLTERFRYTSNSVFDSFPWPQKPSAKAVRAVADVGIEVRKMRKSLEEKYNESLRDLYRELDDPGEHPLKKAQAELDAAVREAYGMEDADDPLAFLLDLNLTLADQEATGKRIQGPGLPDFIDDRSSYVTDDCVLP